jgi:hypothetical protein
MPSDAYEVQAEYVEDGGRVDVLYCDGEYEVPGHLNTLQAYVYQQLSGVASPGSNSAPLLTLGLQAVKCGLNSPEGRSLDSQSDDNEVGFDIQKRRSDSQPHLHWPFDCFADERSASQHRQALCRNAGESVAAKMDKVERQYERLIGSQQCGFVKVAFPKPDAHVSH